jgi:hypothetical protein
MHGGGEPGIARVNLSPRLRLDDVIKRIRAMPLGGTDCALPMLWARRNRLKVSAFVTYTDSETWAGSIHPAQALRLYRDEPVSSAEPQRCLRTAFKAAPWQPTISRTWLSSDSSSFVN